MSYHVIGMRKGTYQPRDSRDTVEYIHLHCITQDERVEGTPVEIVKFPKALGSRTPPIGSEIECVYDKYGKITDYVFTEGCRERIVKIMEEQAKKDAEKENSSDKDVNAILTAAGVSVPGITEKEGAAASKKEKTA